MTQKLQKVAPRDCLFACKNFSTYKKKKKKKKNDSDPISQSACFCPICLMFFFVFDVSTIYANVIDPFSVGVANWQT